MDIKYCGKLCLVVALCTEIAAIIINIVKGHSPFYLFDLSERFGFDNLPMSIFYWGAVVGIIFLAVDEINKAEIGESDEINKAENYKTVSGKQNKELPIKLTKSLKAFLDEEGKTFLEYKYDEQLKKIYLQGNYQYGKKEGESITYHENDQLHYKENYKNGKAEGEWITYHENGQLEFKENYKNGEKEGAWVGYTENGQLETKGNWKNGKRDGVWFYYHPNDQLMTKCNYKKGKKEGEWITYHENGQLHYKENYKNGEEEGEQVSYNTDGSLDKHRSGYYKNGVKISD